MTWDDIEDILYDGTEEQIANIRCPDCGGRLEYSYGHSTNNSRIHCPACGTVVLGHGCHKVPNFARLA